MVASPPYSAVAVAVLYAASFFLPVYFTMPMPTSVWKRIAGGPFGLPHPGFENVLRWSPNPLLWIGIPLLALGRSRQAATEASVLGVLASINALLWLCDSWPGDLGPGYRAWVSSAVLLAVLGAWHANRAARLEAERRRLTQELLDRATLLEDEGAWSEALRNFDQRRRAGGVSPLLEQEQGAHAPRSPERPNLGP
jgi:hypothetical protein